MSSMLLEQTASIGRVVATLDLTDPVAAREALRHLVPVSDVEALNAAVREAHAQGTLTPREANPSVRFGRIAKPSADTGGCSIDAVDIAGAGAGHTHPRGEVSWCVPLQGSPSFEGHGSGWVVLGAGSHHVPTVTGGRMAIVYWIPGGEVDWDG
jgi:2-hydroxylaminobenzoate mutase